MIDNPLQADLLVAKLKAALPLSALAAPPLLAQLHEQAPDRDLSPRCQITGIHYVGDEGGIVCRLDFGQDDGEKVFFISTPSAGLWATRARLEERAASIGA